MLLTFALLFAFAAVPATAAEDRWTLEVNVSNSCEPSLDPASWSPYFGVAYQEGNDVLLNSNRTLVPFSIYLGFEAGYDDCEMTSVDPSGTVQSSFSTTDSELTMNSLLCSSESPCDAGILYNGGSFLLGELDVSALTTVGTKSGSLSVVWTPEG